MNDETFMNYLREVYPNVYDSLVADFTKVINRKKGVRKNVKQGP